MICHVKSGNNDLKSALAMYSIQYKVYTIQWAGEYSKIQYTVNNDTIYSGWGSTVQCVRLDIAVRAEVACQVYTELL